MECDILLSKICEVVPNVRNIVKSEICVSRACARCKLGHNYRAIPRASKQYIDCLCEVNQGAVRVVSTIISFSTVVYMKRGMEKL